MTPCVVVLLSLILSACTALPTQSQINEPDARVLQLAEAYRNDGRLSQSAKILRNLQSQYPQSDAVQLQMAQLLTEQGEFAAAESIYRTLPSDDLEIALAYARLMHRMDRSAACVHALRLADSSTLHPLRADALYQRGHCLLKRVQFEAAHDAIEAALRLEPTHLQARFLEPKIVALKGDYAHAERLLDRLTEDPAFRSDELSDLRHEIATIRARYRIIGAQFGS